MLRYEHSIHYGPEKMFKIFSIVAAICNDVLPPLYSADALRSMQEDATRIVSRMRIENNVAKADKKKGWTGIDFKTKAKVPDFSLDDVRKYSGSSYLMRMAKGYIFHAKKIRFQFLRKAKNTVRVYGIIGKMSRNDNKSPQKYTIIHRFGRSLLDDRTVSWCTCPNGNKTAGCCVHSASSLIYLHHHMHGTDVPETNTRISQHHSQCIDVADWHSDVDPNEIIDIPPLESIQSPFPEPDIDDESDSLMVSTQQQMSISHSVPNQNNGLYSRYFIIHSIS